MFRVIFYDAYFCVLRLSFFSDEYYIGRCIVDHLNAGVELRNWFVVEAAWSQVKTAHSSSSCVFIFDSTSLHSFAVKVLLQCVSSPWRGLQRVLDRLHLFFCLFLIMQTTSVMWYSLVVFIYSLCTFYYIINTRLTYHQLVSVIFIMLYFVRGAYVNDTMFTAVYLN